MMMEIAGNRPPRYGAREVLRGARGGNPLGCAYGIRGPPRYGNIKTRRARLPRRNRDQEVSPTERIEI